MRFQQHPTFGFTTKADGLLRELITEVHVSEAHYTTPGLPVPSQRTYKAIWDTGATNTVICPRIVQELNLKPSGRVTCSAVGAGNQVHQYETDTYLVNLVLPNSVTVQGLKVSEGSVGDVDILIGMDIIHHGDLAVTNYGGKTWFTFRVPSNEPIDFVDEIERDKQKYGLRGGKAPAWLQHERRKKGMQKKKR